MHNAHPQPVTQQHLRELEQRTAADRAEMAAQSPPPVPGKRRPREDRAHRLREDR
jgi:hypothetical protein